MSADLMEVVFVELEKLKNDISDELKDAIAKLFYDTKNFSNAVEKVMPGVQLSGIKEEVKEMVDYNALLGKRLK